MRSLAALVLMVACQGEEKPGKPAVPVEPEELIGACEISFEKVLVITCSATVEPEASVTFVLNGERIEVTESGVEHQIDFSLLSEGELYDWRIEGAQEVLEGSLEMGVVPPDYEFDATTTGELPPGMGIMVESCAQSTLMVINDAGQIVWGVSPEGAGAIKAYAPSEEGAWVVKGNRLRFYDWNQNLLVDKSIDEFGIEKHFHHDVGPGPDGSVAVLYSWEEGQCIYDGVLLVDRNGEMITTIDTRDWYDSEYACDNAVGIPIQAGYWFGRFQAPYDLTHSNSVYWDEDELIVSFKHMSAVVAAVGSGPDLGKRIWAMSGANDEVGAELTPTSSVTEDTVIEANHCVERDADGRLTMVDNGLGAVSRALLLDVDAENGVADIVGSYSMNQVCPVQSSAFSVDDAILMACTAGQNARLVGKNDGLVRWEMTVDCHGRPGGLQRVIPVSLP